MSNRERAAAYLSLTARKTITRVFVPIQVAFVVYIVYNAWVILSYHNPKLYLAAISGVASVTYSIFLGWSACRVWVSHSRESYPAAVAVLPDGIEVRDALTTRVVRWSARPSMTQLDEYLVLDVPMRPTVIPKRVFDDRGIAFEAAFEAALRAWRSASDRLDVADDVLDWPEAVTFTMGDAERDRAMSDYRRGVVAARLPHRIEPATVLPQAEPPDVTREPTTFVANADGFRLMGRSNVTIAWRRVESVEERFGYFYIRSGRRKFDLAPRRIDVVPKRAFADGAEGFVRAVRDRLAGPYLLRRSEGSRFIVNVARR